MFAPDTVRYFGMDEGSVEGGSRGPGHVLGAGDEVFCGRTNRFLLFWYTLALRVVRLWLG